MTDSIRTFIDECSAKCADGVCLSRDELLRLLNVEIGSEDDMYLRKAARRIAEFKTGNGGCIWSAVGMDYVPCKMNCKFCSFGAAWDIIKEPRHVNEEDIFKHIDYYARNGAAYVVLRTTEFYDIDKLLSYVPRIREKIPGDYAIVFNTCELSAEMAEKVDRNGVYGVYHALRLREGQDTPFAPRQRVQTMNNVTATDLVLTSLIEPLGPEHSYEEIADSFINAVECRTRMCGVMSRFPVDGTPFGGTEMVDSSKAAHIIAAVRLAGGNIVRDICVHPATPEALEAGANVLVVEMGAIPRDTDYSADDWTGNGMEQARKLLTEAGYRIAPPPAKVLPNFAQQIPRHK